MNNLLSGFRKLLAIFLLILISACTNGDLASSDADTDGDGLLDSDEISLYKTSPIKVDTDGDGISDFDEIVTFSFDSNLNNYEYNPLIADVPEIDIDIVTAPDIALNYEFSDASTGSSTTSRATSNTTGVTTARTNSTSTAIETSYTTSEELTVGAEFEISLEPSATLSVSATVSDSYTDTTTSEKSFEWSTEQSNENSNTYELAKSLENSKGVSAASGYISTVAKISNTGNRAFTLTGLTLSSAMISQTSNKVVAPVSNLTYDDTNGSTSFPQTSLAGGGSTGNIIFSSTGVDTGTIKSLLADSSGMKVGVAAYELVDINGTPFVYAREQVDASTATVIIDYEALSIPEERYMVATVADPDVLTVTAQSVLTDILKKSYTVDNSGRLSSIGTVTGDGVITGWLVLHKTTNAGSETATVHSYNTDYDFNNIVLKAGDVLHMVYQIDQDGDKLGQRIEAMLGTSTDNIDSDGDGINDYDEVFKGWVVTYPSGTQLRVSSSPVSSDTDGDGLTDAEELTLLTDPRSNDTDGDLLSDATDPDPLTVNYQLHAQNLMASFTDVDISTGDVSLNWGHTWSGDFTSGRDIILRQISNSAAYGTDLPVISSSVSSILTSTGDWLACGAETNCWEVVGIQAISNSDGIGTYTLSDNGLSRTNTYRYAIVSEFNNGSENFYLFDTINPPVETATAGSLKRVTITINSVRMAADCVDLYNDDAVRTYGNCEPYYTVTFNNVLIGSYYNKTNYTDVNYTSVYPTNLSPGMLTPAYDIYVNNGSNLWSDTTHPDTSRRSGSATAYVDVLDTTTSLPLYISGGEWDIFPDISTYYQEQDGTYDGEDNTKSLTVNVTNNDLAIGTSHTVGSTLSWDANIDGYTNGLKSHEKGAIEFTYTVTVTALP